MYTPVIWYSAWFSCEVSRPTLIANCRASYVICHLPSSSSILGILGQVPPGGEVVVPTAIPTGTRCTAAGLRSQVHVLRVPACIGRVPALHGRTAPVPIRSCPPDPRMGHPGPVRSKSMVHPPPQLPVCLVIALLHLVRSPRHLPGGTSSRSRAMRSCWPLLPLAAPSILMWSRGRKSTK